NAQNAMPAGGRIRIVVEPVTVNQPPVGIDAGDGQFVSLVVTDVGHGASREVQRHMGEPFFTTDHGKHTGLGLATVSGLMRAHGGWLAVTSAVAHGTSVRLFFPSAGTNPARNQPLDEECTRGKDQPPTFPR